MKNKQKKFLTGHSQFTYDQHLPKFTYGLEGKLLNLIGEPILLAQRAVRNKFEQELSTNEGMGVRYTYHIQKISTYICEKPSSFLWKEQEKIFHTSIPTITQRFNFRVDLWEDSEGRLKKFSFALEVS